MKKKYNIDDELDNIDLTGHIKNAQWIGKKSSGRKKIGRRISIVLPDDLIAQLTLLGKERGLGYQTMARLFLMQKITDEMKHEKK